MPLRGVGPWHIQCSDIALFIQNSRHTRFNKGLVLKRI
ncbi:MAG: hypothetical protein GY816_07025 [Cytophagales bacterium]|nr:hypothetical protein [Cytophagales bacterium]